MNQSFPLGSALTVDQLGHDPHPYLAELRASEPVSWVPALNGWLVTRRDLCVEVMRDSVTFTVDDPRFSTAQVVGPSMLSLDGTEHRRHRDPFAAAFRLAEVRQRFADRVDRHAQALVGKLAPRGSAEIRRDLSGPLAVAVVSEALDLLDVDPGTVLGWYDHIVGSVDRVSAGQGIGREGAEAVARLRHHVGATIDRGVGILSSATGALVADEVASNAAVMMFGGIETSEGMTTTLFWHLLSTPDQWEIVKNDPSLRSQAIEESLRLEPAAARVDRYATVSTELAGASIGKGDLVIVSLTAANRDPETFDDPDRFDLSRANARSHVAFAQGPHACVGLHLARMETLAALEAVLEAWPALEISHGTSPPTGLIFRKPHSLHVRWRA